MMPRRTALLPYARAVARDIVGIAGVAAILTGLREIYQPLALIVLGAGLVYAALVMARRG